MSKFSELVKHNRAMLHLTQAEYAERFGAESATSVSLWESGQRKVPERVIEALIYEPLPRYTICEYCSGRGMLEIAINPPTETEAS